ncbi:Flagellar hook-associated protein 1 [Planctomycetes bacterium Pla163]|uniref:Flagellar hook-associated protein 1 n=2 Tax=Rohdeia mirabilis TaxID=2528008 RepID=A0A518D508_9BACT|nr:Flagellar hook-associated protein 1 [Planctomycetes bacterium Pla163]
MGSIGMNTGLQALLTAQYALDTVGNNIANASTPGYSRQKVGLAAGIGLDRGNILVGTGVLAGDLTRVVDDLLNRRIVGQLSIVGRLDQQLQRANEIQSIFGDLDGVGIGSMLDNFFDQISSLSIDPSDPVRRSSLVQGSEILATRFNEVNAGLEEAQTSTKSQAEIVVRQINDLAAQIADLNVKINEVEGGQVTANSLRDQRQQMLEQLSELVPIQVNDSGPGGVRVHVGGALLVDASTTLPLELQVADDGTLAVMAEGANSPLKNLSGKLGGLLNISNDFVSDLKSGLDGLASQLILEVNRVHTTGVPGSGPFNKLVAATPLKVAYEGGVLGVQKLSDSGLPFEISNGELTVNVHDTVTGLVVKHTVAIDPDMQVQELVDAISSIPDVQAYVDDAGHFTMTSSTGHAFEFSNLVVPHPDVAGTFGGAKASIGTGASEPFALVDGDTLDLSVMAGGIPSTVSVAFSASDFAAIGSATAEELAAVLNGDAAFAASGAVAVAKDGGLFVQTTSGGTTESLTITGGSAVGALGLAGAVGQTVTGALDSVDVEIGGSYDGAGDEVYTLRPTGEGSIGTTPGLTVEVVDSSGQVVGSLDVGEGYVPGTSLQLANGLTASFGIGDVSALAGDRLSVEATADSDTSDVLAVLGLNTYFEGSDAGSIKVRDELVDDPSLLASSSSGSGGNNGTLLALLELQDRSLEALGGQDFGERYGQMIAGVGFEVGSADASSRSSRAVLESLQSRRDSISGVNVDEELVSLIRFEQSFQAASRYIAALGEMEDTILSLI